MFFKVCNKRKTLSFLLEQAIIEENCEVRRLVKEKQEEKEKLTAGKNVVFSSITYLISNGLC